MNRLTRGRRPARLKRCCRTDGLVFEPAHPSTDSSGFERWTFHDISGVAQGVKFDRIELSDLDTHGDLDIVTCEERDNLGVIWYENPRR